MVFHKSALFTDMTENYVEPCEPWPHEKVKVRFRTGRNNVDKVMICYHGQKVMMKKETWDDLFDYYSYHIRMTEETLYYHFEIQSEGKNCYYNRLGVCKEEDTAFDFLLIPGFSTPDWAKGAVIYQIYIDRFCNGDTANDVQSGEYCYLGMPVERVEDWNELPKSDDERRFYGGDLQGVIDKLAYLKDLGVDAVYLNPVFVSPSSHKYDIQDYDHVDPHIGKILNDSLENCYSKRTTDKENLEASDRMLITLIEEAHKRGIRVILDGVFDHCSSFHRFFDREGTYADSDIPYEKGAYQDKESPYRNYFKYTGNGDFCEKWWGYDAMPKFNYENASKLYEYALSVGAKWVSKPYCADGWRLDVAADLGHSREFNHKFWQDFRIAVKEANPQALILAEHYGPAKEWLMGREWDSIMNYDAFMEPITWFLTGMEKHSDGFHKEWIGNANIFWTSMQTAGLNFSHSSAMTAMNELSNHDHSRFLTRTNHTVGRLGQKESCMAEHGVSKAIMRAAVVMQMTWPGAPTIYYGDEAGVCGFTDPDNRRTYPWGREDKEMIAFYQEMIRIHKQNQELIKGSLIKLYAQPFVTAYGRFMKEEQIVVIVNCSDCIKDAVINVWRAGIPSDTKMNRIMVTTNEGFNTDAVQIPVIKGKLEVSLLPQSAIVLKHINKSRRKSRESLFKKI